MLPVNPDGLWILPKKNPTTDRSNQIKKEILSVRCLSPYLYSFEQSKVSSDNPCLGTALQSKLTYQNQTLAAFEIQVYSSPFCMIWQCNQCQQDFRRQYDLKRHLKLHTGEKPFFCIFCSRSFARSDALHRHQRLNGTTCHPTKPGDAKPIQNDLPFVLLPSLKSEYDQMKESLCTLKAQYQSQQDQIEGLKSAYHDLQVEVKP